MGISVEKIVSSVFNYVEVAIECSKMSSMEGKCGIRAWYKML